MEKLSVRIERESNDDDPRLRELWRLWIIVTSTLYSYPEPLAVGGVYYCKLPGALLAGRVPSGGAFEDV